MAEAVLGELARILHAYVARLQTDPARPSARAVDEAQLEDHLASFLGNLAATLPSLGDARSAMPRSAMPRSGGDGMRTAMRARRARRDPGDDPCGGRCRRPSRCRTERPSNTW
jgi:hypothetical protein